MSCSELLIAFRCISSLRADAKSINELGETTLHKSTEDCRYSVEIDGHEAIVNLLIDNGADVNVREQDVHRTALHHTARGGREGIARILLDHGADIDARDSGGWAALHSAAQFRNETIVRLLLDRGVDINGRDMDGLAALHRAVLSSFPSVSCKYEAITRLLLDKGVEANAKCSSGRTAYHFAVFKRR